MFFMGWNGYPPPKPPPLGEWETYDCGSDYHGWTLKCGTLFYGQIHLAGGSYFVQLNGRALDSAKSLDEAKDAVERAIIARVRAMLPAYRVVYGRVMHRDGKPPDEPPPVGPPQLRAVRAA
ncbi:MAG TPA: hypothetical protein VFA87_05300 [Rhizomicrobium sp.]|nr:hypothetical protein [Rhizomicrobium sp.]